MSYQTDRLRIFQRQAHACAHLIANSLIPEIAFCPICLGPFGGSDLHGCEIHQPAVSIEHAPPRQRNRLGIGREACLTHVACQGSIKYESDAGRYQSDLKRLRDGQPATLRGRLDGEESWVTLQRRSGVVRPVGTTPGQAVAVSLTLPLASQLTELKAAFIIAFTALGYSWAAQPGLDTVRATIQTGDTSTTRRIPLFLASDPSPDLANTVLVSEGADRIAVIGDDPKFGILLPLSQSSTIGSEQSMDMSGYAVPWLPNRWWRDQSVPAFLWDCSAKKPLWRVEPPNDHPARHRLDLPLA